MSQSDPESIAANKLLKQIPKITSKWMGINADGEIMITITKEGLEDYRSLLDQVKSMKIRDGHILAKYDEAEITYQNYLKVYKEKFERKWYQFFKK